MDRDGGLSSLADDLLDYQHQQVHRSVGIDELAADLLAEIPGPAGEQAEQLPEGLEPWMAQVVQQPQQDLTLAYGPPEVVQLLGNDFQKQMMKRVFTELSRQNRTQKVDETRRVQDKTHSVVLDYFVLSKKTVSVAAVSTFSGVGEKTLKRGLESTASFTLHGGTWLVGAMLASWRKMFQAGVAYPVLFLARMKYDETPLKLKVSEYNKVFSSSTDAIISSNLRPSHQEEYRFAKIFRILYTLGASD